MKKQFYTLLCMAGLIASFSSCSNTEPAPDINTPGYYFAVTSLDEWGNESALSNVAFNENAMAPTVSKAISDISPAVKANYVANKSARQSVDNAVPNVLYVKFKKPLGAQSISLSADGKSVGVANVDAVTSKIAGARLEKCFPSGPKTEARHREAGLDLWYYVVFDNNDKAQLSRTVEMFDMLDEIEYVETMKVGQVRRIDDNPIVKATPSIIASEASRGAALPFNDPLLKDQWHYDNLGIAGINERSNVNLFKAWEKNTGDKDVIVAIVDMGVDYNHEDLKDVMWVNEGEIPDNGIDDDGNGYIDDIHGFNFSPKMNADGSWPPPPYIYTGPIEPGDHGTHVAGTVGAVNNNGIGVCGVAGGGADGKGGVRLMSAQIFGWGGAADDSGNLIHQAIVYAADNGAVIAQNSWGQANIGTAPAIVEEAFVYFMKNAGNKEMFPNSPMVGGVAIATTGNADNSIATIPAVFKGVIGVSSVNHERKKADSATYGDMTDLCAPGGNSMRESEVIGVLSTVLNNEYGYKSGTSMACPHVSGIAALYVSQNKGAVTPDMVRQRLLSSCISLADTEPNYYKFLGKGLIDANKVLRVDGKQGPEAIKDLEIRVNGGGFELAWTVPADEDSYASGYKVYFSKTPITENTISQLKFDERTYSDKEVEGSKAAYVIK